MDGNNVKASDVIRKEATMHEIKEYIRKIVDDGSIEEMYKLSDMLDELAHTVKQFDENLYKKYKMELYSMAYR